MSSEQHSPERRKVSIRRAPRFVPFLALGAIAGFIAAVVVAYTGPESADYTREATLGFFTIMFALPGLALGAGLALLLDWISVRRTRTRTVESMDEGPSASGE